MKKTPIIITIVAIIIVLMIFVLVLKQTGKNDIAIKGLEKKGLNVEELPQLNQVIDLNTKEDTIKLLRPAPNEIISSPLLIKGEARGEMFFEAVFPIELVDETGKIIATTQAQAKADWMTHEFVPFEAKLIFDVGPAKKVKLIFKNDNPSGQPENELKFDWDFMIN